MAALVAAMVLIRRRRLLAVAGLSALAASAIWICAVPPRPQVQAGALEVTAIDVGQGDSILLVSPEGRMLLVDAGGTPFWMHSELDIGEDVVSPYLWSRGIGRLDAVAVTHAHADHIGGMGAVLANFHPRELWLGADSSSAEQQHLLRESKLAAQRRFAGDESRLRRDFGAAGRRCGEGHGAAAGGRGTASRSAESGASRQRDFDDSRAAGGRASALCGDFGGRAQSVRASA
jgi:beta-lactamase superfamily II metal-dependent hydrolase